MSTIHLVEADMAYTQFAAVEPDPWHLGWFASGVSNVAGRPIQTPTEPLTIKLNRERDGTLGGRMPADCTGFTGGCLLLSQTAVTRLEPFFGPAGTFMRTQQTDLSLDFYAFICRNEVAALDESRSTGMRTPDGKLFRIQNYAFDAQAVRGQHVFRLPERREIFVSTEVVEAIREHDLSGFHIEAVWNAVTGAVERPRFPPVPSPDIWKQDLRAKNARQRERLRSQGVPDRELTGKLRFR
jgi:hypothetical protein